MSSKVAIITARGGSKRIPRKNIRPFLGKPIIAYSIEAAINSNLFDMVIVSTDDTEIAKLSKKLGAEVPFLRSTKNSDDHATTIDVLLEVISELEKEGVSFDYGCCLYPTAPFTTPTLLKESFQKLTEDNNKFLFPITPFNFPIQRALRLDLETTRIVPFYKEDYFKRSQDLEHGFHDCGMFYWFNTEELKLKQTIFTNDTIGFPIPPNQCQDIDTEEDWEIAEIKYRRLQQN